MTEYIELANPYVFPLKVAALSFAVALAVIVIVALFRRRGEMRWYDMLLAGALTISFAGTFVLALDADKFDPTRHVSANVYAKYKVDSVKVTGTDLASMTAQVNVDGIQIVYNLANDPETSEPLLVQTKNYDPVPETLERTK